MFIGEVAWVEKGLGQPLLRYDGRILVDCLKGQLRESLRLYGQVNKRTWWMPWQPEAMKDAVGSEIPRGAVKQALIRGCPNGETHPIYRVSQLEYIGL